KYLPLATNNYGGSIIYSQNGRELRLERNLLKGKDKVSIYDNLTGADITEEFYYDDAVRLYVPFFANEMNRRIFNNTISIEQLGSKTSSVLANEVSNKLINYAQTKSEISIDHVLSNLDSKGKQLGTARRKNTPIYEIETAIESLR